MKVSLEWIKQFTEVTGSVDEIVDQIGTQLGAVESVDDLSEQYKGVIIATIVSCEKHPNADSLSVCWLDDGGVASDVERNDAGHVQVVCGAPNVRQGLSVAWLPPGTTVPSSYGKDPFVLTSRELRGIVSHGMLASASELAIGDSHDGIVELDIAAIPGSSFAEVYSLNDTIIDIENKMFTHRPDCFGILGVAREIAGIQHRPFVSPDWYAEPLNRPKLSGPSVELSIQNNAGHATPRIMAVAMREVVVKPSPFILQTYLSRVGIRPINNLVDITNYLMVLTGQPLHAYDADKLRALAPGSAGLSLESRLSRIGDKLTLLNGKQITFDDETTVLMTSNDIPVGIAGVMGGADTEVDESTTNILIECANFDMYAVRRASMKYGIFSDAVTRFNKGQSRLQNDRVIEEAVMMVTSIAGGSVASSITDVHASLDLMPTVTVTADFINGRLGLALAANEIAKLLSNVECSVSISNETLLITVPFWRTDIAIPEDIVEEIGRLYGFDRLPLVLPLRDARPVVPDRALDLKQRIRSRLAQAGANEVLTYSFIHGNLMTKVGQNPTLAFSLTNALSPDLQYYRLSITPSLLEKVHPNIKAGYNEFALFELGKVHSNTQIGDDKVPKEFNRLGFLLAKHDKRVPPHAETAYYQAKHYLEYVLRSSPQDLHYERFDTATAVGHQLFDQMCVPFEPLRSARVYRGEELLGIVGEYTAATRKALKLPDYSAGFELFLQPLDSLLQSTENYVPPSRYPATEQDITLRVSADVSYQTLESILVGELAQRTDLHTVVRPVSMYQKPDDTHHVQITFSVAISSYQQTLTTETVNLILNDLTTVATAAVQASRV